MARNGVNRLWWAARLVILLLALATAAGLVIFTALGAFRIYAGLTVPERHLQWSELVGIGGTIGVLVLILAFLLVLGKIIAGVGSDPFTRENAGRVRRLGWLALSWQVLAVATGMVGPAAYFMSSPWLRVRVIDQHAVSGTGPLLVLALFILAHVFHQGAEMRDELDGTV